MMFFLIHKLFQTNCLKALGTALVFGSIIYLFLLLIVKSPIFCLLIPLDLVFTYHQYITHKILDLTSAKVLPSNNNVTENSGQPSTKVILKKLPASPKIIDTPPDTRESIKYVQRLPKIRDTLHHTVQNLGI